MSALNIFRLSGDLLHLLSFLLLFRKILLSRSCAGISLKSIQLYAIVFCCRYLDLYDVFNHSFSYIMLYNSIMKILYIGFTFAIMHLIRKRFAATYDREHDTFRIVFVVAPCFLLALLIYEDDSHMGVIFNILWTFSIYLEALTVLPQLFLLQRTGEINMLTADYVGALGAYRAMYLLNWVYRLFTEEDYWAPIVWVSGIIQTALYVDFFYYYLRSKWYGSKIVLPS